MGQKVNPVSLRLGVNRPWDSNWYVGKKQYVATLHQDLAIKKAILSMKEIKDNAEIAKIEISRNPQRTTVTMHTSRPAVLIGKDGQNVDQITKMVEKITGSKVSVKIRSVEHPQADSQLVASSVARQLEARGSYKRALKKAVADAMKNGAEGIKIKVSGRLNGAEIARSDSIKEGRVPLHTLRSSIDYTCIYAHTSYGSIGVKVWIYNGVAGAAPEKEKHDAGSVVKAVRRAPSAKNDAE